MKTNNNNYLDFEHLLGKLKKEDTNYSSLSKALLIIYLIMIPLYIVITALEYFETKDVFQIVGGACFVISFSVFAIFFRIYYKEYKYVDYSLPTIQMLKKAAYRYKPFQLRTLWILPALVLMDLGLYFTSSFDIIGIKAHLYFIALMFLSIIAGIIVWYFKYKPIRDNALKLIKELEGE